MRVARCFGGRMARVGRRPGRVPPPGRRRGSSTGAAGSLGCPGAPGSRRPERTAGSAQPETWGCPEAQDNRRPERTTDSAQPKAPGCPEAQDNRRPERTAGSAQPEAGAHGRLGTAGSRSAPVARRSRSQGRLRAHRCRGDGSLPANGVVGRPGPLAQSAGPWDPAQQEPRSRAGPAQQEPRSRAGPAQRAPGSPGQPCAAGTHVTRRPGAAGAHVTRSPGAAKVPKRGISGRGFSPRTFSA
ncbi:hypothetical protein SNARM312S_06583 [Streptomyces narbonensis]